MPTTTTTYSFNKPVVGADEDAWGGYLNGNWDSVDDLLDGTTPVTGIDINSGTIDNVVIGGTTAAAITGTTGQFNTSLNVDGTVTADGLTVEGPNSATVSIIAPTDNATLEIRGGNSDAGVEEANIAFYQNNAGKWQLGNATDNSFKLYNYAVSNYALTIDSNNDISFYEDTGTTAKFFWDASAERLAVGGTTTNATLHVHGNSVISNGNFFSIQSASGLSPELDEASNGWAFTTNGTERMRIDSSGNLLVGKTSAGAASAGFESRSSGYTAITRDGGQPLEVRRLTSDGVLIDLRKDGTTVGSIRSEGGDIVFGNDTRGLKFRDSDVIPRDMDNTTADDVVSLGSSTSRFKDLYLSGGVYLGGTGAANKLDDYEEGTWTAQLSDGTNISSTTATGYYTKVGRIVHCMVAQFTNISTSGMSGILRLSLPFTPSSGGFYSSGAAVMFSGSFPSNTYALRTSIYHGETLGYLQAVGTSGASSLSTSNITSGTTDISQITFSYITA